MPAKKFTPEMVETLKKRVNQWNTVQGIRKQELGLLPNIWSSQNAGMYRQRFYALQGNETGLDQISREQIVRLSRELFFQLPIVGVASELKSEYVVGSHWNFCYKGTNTAWGEQAENFINNEWYNNCSTRGYCQDFKTTLKILSRTLDMDGDVLMVKVRNKQGWPLLQFIGSHRIGSMSTQINPGKNAGTVEMGGKKFKCSDGIIFDDMDKPIGYSIKPDDAQIATVPQDPKLAYKPIIISGENAQLVYKPLVFDKARGLPALYASVLYGLQMEDLDNFLMDIAKLEATIAYVLKNDAGQAPQEYENLLNQIQSAGANSNVNIPSLEPTVHGVNVIKGPTINYVKSDGGDLKSFQSDRPGESIQQYQKTIETKLLAAIGIPHQVIYSPETISGRSVNAITSMINISVAERQQTMRRYIKNAISWVLSVAMEEGYIPKNYDEDISKSFELTLPPEFRLDANADNRQNLELFKVGLMSGEEFSRENNQDFAQTCEKRDQEINILLDYVTKAKAKYPNMPESVILNLYTQRGNSSLSITDASPTDAADGA